MHFVLGGEIDASKELILQLRLSKVVSATMIGISLPVSGFLLQELFKNPLAGPSVLGVSSSSSMFVALFIFLGLDAFFASYSMLNEWILAFCASIGSLLSLGILLLISSKVQTSSAFILVGFLFSAFSGAVVSILEYLSNGNEIKNYLMWSLGSFSGLTFNQSVVFILGVLVGLYFAFLSIYKLRGMMMGEEYAKSMGINKFTLYGYIILSTSLLVGSSVAFVGPVSFIGIVVPHFCRYLYKPSKLWNQFSLNILVGASFVLFFLFISERFKVPINILTVFIGIPTTIFILLDKKNSF